MSPTVTTFLFEAVNVLVLAAVLSWLFFNPVRKTLSDRRDALAAEKLEADERLQQAEMTREEINHERSALQAELHNMRAQSLASAQAEAAQVLDKARADGEQQIQNMRRQADGMLSANELRLADAAAAAAANCLAHLLHTIQAPELEAALLRAACQQLTELPREAILPLTVSSAAPLDESSRAMICVAAGQQQERLSFLVDADLGVGVRIATAHGVIDLSSKGLAAFARQSLVAAFHETMDSNDGN